MNQSSKTRLLWFDANRVFAAMGVVLIHSTTDFSGQPFADAEPAARLIPVFLRSIGEFSGSEMFFMFSLFLMAMRVDRKMPGYGTAIGQQAKRLLVPFAFWTLFYVFFRLAKAEAFGYTPYIWDQIADLKNWAGYLILGKSQYHMHFLPTLFALFLFYPVMRVAMRYPMFGFAVLVTIGVMNSAQAFVWSTGIDPFYRDYIVRALKIFGYVGYGLAAFAIYGLWKDGIPRGESRLIRRAAFYFVGLAYIATLPFFAIAYETGGWGIRNNWDYYGHFLMPVFVFFVFLGGQFLPWSKQWSFFARFSFGVYLVHPFVIDLFDIFVFKTGLSQMMQPWMLVLSRYAFALPLSFAVAYGLSKGALVAWTIGLGPLPWERGKAKPLAGA